MRSPLGCQLLVGIFGVSERRIDHIVELIYRGHAEGHIDDEEASRLFAAAQLRRSVFEARRTAQSPKALTTPPHRGGSNREKRRIWSASGALPPVLRRDFTPGENAVAAVIRAEVRRHGFCELPYSAIARSAGIASTTVVKRFVRKARRMRLIEVEERPVRGHRHKPNVIKIVSRKWKSWNDVDGREDGGGTTVPPYQNTQKKISLRNRNDANWLGKKAAASTGLSAPTAGNATFRL